MDPGRSNEGDTHNGVLPLGPRTWLHSRLLSLFYQEEEEAAALGSVALGPQSPLPVPAAALSPMTMTVPKSPRPPGSSFLPQLRVAPCGPDRRAIWADMAEHSPRLSGEPGEAPGWGSWGAGGGLGSLGRGNGHGKVTS